MQIGRKIYYDLATGNVIQDTGEREGSVIETTFEQDIMAYVSLAERVPETVSFIQLEFGELAQDFRECNGYIIVAVNAPFIDEPTTSDDMTTFILTDSDLRFGSTYENVKLNGEVVSEGDYTINLNGRVTFLESVEGDVTISGAKHFSLEFSYPDPNTPEAPPIYQKPLSEEVVSMKAQIELMNLNNIDIWEALIPLIP